MKAYFKLMLLTSMVFILSLALTMGLAGTVLAANTTYYVDCSAATNGNGTQSSPWNSFASPNATTFGPGDSLLFKRGTTCNGGLVMHGSGTATSPITIADYGTGAQPILDGGTTNTDVVALTDVEYYNINNLAIRGGSLWGLHIKAATAGIALHHFYLTNLDISAVNHVATARNDSGLLNVEVFSKGTNATISDVLVDGVTTHDTTGGEGMTIGGGNDWPCPAPCYGTGFTVRNSTSYNMYGDAIVMWELNNGLIENNVAYESGKCPIGACSGSTPVGIWTWATFGVVVQNNESYSHHTWATASGDGGGFDIDGDNFDNTYQYNYAHDSEGFCVGVYDFNGYGSGLPNQNGVFRYNLCANNVQRVVDYGEIRVATWQGGNMISMEFYNNTFYYNPAPGAIGGDSAALKMGANYSSNSFFKNNIIYSLYKRIARTDGALAYDYNLYYNPSGQYEWKLGNGLYSSFSAWQGAGNDPNSISADPQLNGLGYHGVGMPSLANGYYTLQSGSPALGAGTNVCAGGCNTGSMGTHDFYGQALGATHNIGAYDNGGGGGPTPTPVPPTNTPTRTNTPVPPTATNTPGGPTNTPTNTPTSTPTSTLTRTNTPVPTNTPTNTPTGPTATPGGTISRTGWTVTCDSVRSGYPCSNAIDGATTTFWHTNYQGSTCDALPHWIDMDMGTTHQVNGLLYLPRQDGLYYKGGIGQHEIYISADGVNWGTAVATGTWPSGAAEQSASFANISGRYVRLKALTEADNNGACTAVAEVNLTGQ